MPDQPLLLTDDGAQKSVLALPIAQGGTGADNAAAALTNLGIFTDDSVIDIVDHYMMTSQPASTPLGVLGLVPTFTGASAVQVQTPTNVNPGVIAIDTGTAATNHGLYRTHPLSIMFGGLLFRFKMVIRLSAVPDGTNSFNVSIGFGDSTAANTVPTDACRFTCSQTNANWFAETRSNNVNTGTNTNTGVAVNANFNTFEIEVNKAGTQVRYWINDVLAATHTTNIPVGSGRETGINLAIQKTVGTTARQLQLDFTRLRIDSR